MRSTFVISMLVAAAAALPGTSVFELNKRCGAFGTTCQYGDDCCSGYCSPSATGPFTCGTSPSQQCTPIGQNCIVDSQCCNNGYCKTTDNASAEDWFCEAR